MSKPSLAPLLLLALAAASSLAQQPQSAAATTPPSAPAAILANPSAEESSALASAWSQLEKDQLILQNLILHIQLEHKAENWEYNFQNRVFYVQPSSASSANQQSTVPAARPGQPAPKK